MVEWEFGPGSPQAANLSSIPCQYYTKTDTFPPSKPLRPIQSLVYSNWCMFFSSKRISLSCFVCAVLLEGRLQGKDCSSINALRGVSSKFSPQQRQVKVLRWEGMWKTVAWRATAIPNGQIVWFSIIRWLHIFVCDDLEMLLLLLHSHACGVFSTNHLTLGLGYSA